MPVTMQQVLAYLNADEPRYAEAARLGEDAIPHLQSIVATGEALLASKATYLAGLLRIKGSVEVVGGALSHREPSVRVAAAAALPFLPLESAHALFARALRDPDTGVRQLALNALPHRVNARLAEVLESVVRNDAEPGLRMRSEQILTRWREELLTGSPIPPNADLLAAFPVSDRELVLHCAAHVHPKMTDARFYRSDRGVTIRDARIEAARPNQIVLVIDPLPHLPLVADSITVLDFIPDNGKSLGERRSPRFLHGVHTPMELKVPHMEPAFPFRSTLAGLHVTLECCTGCNGGIHDRDLVVVNNHTGGGWSGIWVRTAKVIEGPYPRWQRVMFAGGVLTDQDGALTIVDQGWMQVTKGDEAPHHAPPPLPIRTKDIPAAMTESLLTKSLDGSWVEINNVEVRSIRVVNPEKSTHSRTLRRIEAVIDDGSGVANAWLYQPTSAKVAAGQRLTSLRGFVHAEGAGVYVLLSDKDEDLRF